VAVRAPAHQLPVSRPLAHRQSAQPTSATVIGRAGEIQGEKLMRVATAGILGVVFGIGVVVGTSLTVSGKTQPAAVSECGTMSIPQLRTTLYFGLARPKGAAVSELEWQLFLRDDVTVRCSVGLAAWE